MRYLPSRQAAASSSNSYKNHTVASQPFSEREILELHDMFMTPGIHNLTVDNIVTGRATITVMLTALHYYHDVAVLTVAGLPLDGWAHDLYNSMARHGTQPDQIKEFLTQDFMSEFLWIEQTPTLRQQTWYPDFKWAIHELQLDARLPIIIMSYHNNN